MRILAITNDKYLYRKLELELDSHILTKSESDAHELIIYDEDSRLPIPDSQAPRILLTRGDGKGYLLPMPLGELKGIVERQSEGGQRLSLDSSGQHAILDGRKIKLTEHEYRLLELLILGKEEYTSREQIAKTVWEGASDGLINIYIHYLRRKLEGGEERVILSSRSLGYKINGIFIGRKG